MRRIQKPQITFYDIRILRFQVYPDRCQANLPLILDTGLSTLCRLQPVGQTLVTCFAFVQNRFANCCDWSCLLLLILGVAQQHPFHVCVCSAEGRFASQNPRVLSNLHFTSKFGFCPIHMISKSIQTLFISKLVYGKTFQLA